MKYSKISNKTKWYIRTVTLLIYICILMALYLLQIVCTLIIDINDYIPISIDIARVCKIMAILITFIVLVLYIIFPKLVYKNYAFYTDKYFFKVKSGIIFKNISIVLVKNVYKVSIKKKIIGRIFGISSIKLSTSAGNIKINFIDDKRCENLFNTITYAMKNYEVG